MEAMEWERLLSLCSARRLLEATRSISRPQQLMTIYPSLSVRDSMGYVQSIPASIKHPFTTIGTAISESRSRRSILSFVFTL